MVPTSLLIKHPARLKMIRAPKEAREPYRRIHCYAWVTFPQPRESRWEVPSITWHLGWGCHGVVPWACMEAMDPSVFSLCTSFGERNKDITTNLRNRSIKVPPSPPVCHLPRNALGHLPSSKQPRNKSVAFRQCMFSATSPSPALLGLAV